MTSTNTIEGDTPEMLGAVKLAKGWVATMLKPPNGRMFDVHNFERILIQQGNDANFFASDETYDKLMHEDYAGIAALVGRLEKECHDYLNTTWKEGAMKKVLEKLEEKEFELKLLGVVIEEDEKDRLAKLEVERRLGPNSPVTDLYKRFTGEVLHQQFLPKVRK